MICDTLPTVETINLEQIIDNVLKDKINSDVRDYSYFHSSELNQCHRKLVYKYYAFNGIIQNADEGSSVGPVLQRVFDNGHHLHYRLRDNLIQTKFLRGVWRCAHSFMPNHPPTGTYGTEEKLGIFQPEQCECGCKKFHYEEVGFMDEDTLIGGHVDAILDFRGHTIQGNEIESDTSIEESHLVVDFKSISTFLFSKLEKPYDSHFSQMQIYLYLSGLKYGKFLYESKNDQKFREFLVERDEDFIADKVARAKALKRIVTNKNSKGVWTLPPRPYQKSSAKECMQDCNFKSHCWGLE